MIWIIIIIIKVNINLNYDTLFPTAIFFPSGLQHKFMFSPEVCMTCRALEGSNAKKKNMRTWTMPSIETKSYIARPINEQFCLRMRLQCVLNPRGPRWVDLRLQDALSVLLNLWRSMINIKGLHVKIKCQKPIVLKNCQ